MNRFFVFATLLVSIVLNSCQFSENIYINSDGSCKMEFSFDGTQLMQMAGDKMLGQQEKAIDSTFSFKELFDANSDSISKLSVVEQQKLKQLEPFKMHLLMNPETSQMKFDMFGNFKTVNELQDMFKAMKNFGDLKGKEKANAKVSPFSFLGVDENTILDYNFNGKTFKRVAKIIDKVAYKQVTDSLGQMAMMFDSSTYSLKYHFPKRIKLVSNPKATLSDDRKSVTVSYDFMDYITNPEVLNLEIVLED